MELCSKKNCSGCGICQAVCNHDAISLKEDFLGFRYPEIDSGKCVDCGLCRKKCPVINPVEKGNYNDCYIAWAINDSIHYESSSGGISYLLQKLVVESGGYVVGCVWDDNFNAILKVIDTIDDVKKTIGSKYVHSYIAGDTWREIRERNKQGQMGLVIGLPCQIAAVKSFTNNSPTICFVDLLCRGGCSPSCLKTHLAYIKRKKKLSDITDIRFRGGKNDCTITLWNDNKIVYQGAQFVDAYFYSFMKHGLLRESCYQCQYANSNRVSDITLADYQGVDPDFVKDKNIMNGANLVLIHSNKGQNIWNKIKEQVECYKRPFEEAVEGNTTLKEPTLPPSDRELLVSLVEEKGFEKAVRYDPIYRHNNNLLRLMKARVYGIVVMMMRGVLSEKAFSIVKNFVKSRNK